MVTELYNHLIVNPVAMSSNLGDFKITIMFVIHFKDIEGVRYV